MLNIMRKRIERKNYKENVKYNPVVSPITSGDSQVVNGDGLKIFIKKGLDKSSVP